MKNININTRNSKDTATAAVSFPRSHSHRDIERQIRAERTRAENLLRQFGWHEDRTDEMLWAEMSMSAMLNISLDDKAADWPEGHPPMQTLNHSVRLPDAAAVDLFIEAVDAKQLGLQHVSTKRLTESLEDHRVTLRHDCRMSAAEVTFICCTLWELADAFGGAFEDWEREQPPEAAADPIPGFAVATNLMRMYQGDVLEAQLLAARSRRVFKMRVEFLHDALVARQILAPYVCKWTEGDTAYLESAGRNARVDGMDSEVEFELSVDAPSLDQLRWLLDQVVDLHVAAQSLHYADQYTGDRLPYDLLERMTPPAEILAAMLETQERVVLVMGVQRERFDAFFAKLRTHAPTPPAVRGRRQRARAPRRIQRA